MHESQGEQYLEPMLECDQEILDPLGEAGLIPVVPPNININVCRSGC
jgi:hypothetical protein